MLQHCTGLIWSRGDAFSVRHLPTRQGDTVRVFAATRASAECAFALRFAAGALRLCVFVRPPFPTMSSLLAVISSRGCINTRVQR